MTRDEDIALCRIWSASLPAIFGAPARPWNGRELTAGERAAAAHVYTYEGPQGALEWLSEHVHG